MNKLHSGMDAWRFIVRSDTNRKSLESYLPLFLSAAGALGVLPFAILRFMQQQWIAAAIDAIIVIGFLVLGSYVYRTRQVRAASILIASYVWAAS